MKCLFEAAASVVLFLSAAVAASAVEYVYPADANIIDVKRDFGAKGDGIADDTAALQKAIVTSLLGDYRNPKVIYLPVGTYLISDALRARITTAPDHQGGWSDGWRCGLVLVGQSREKTIIRIKDRCPAFADKTKPLAMIYTGSTDHSEKQVRAGGIGNEGFQNYLMNFTVDTGRGNAGAVGINYLASNRGMMEEITVRSGDPAKIGVCGIDTSRWCPGPALVKNVSVDGFDWGLHQDGMDCSMTYEHLTFTNQLVCVVRGTNQPFMSLRGIMSRNAVPVFQIDGGSAVINILDSTFTWTGTGTAPSAITSQGCLVLKHVTVDGYPVVVSEPNKKEAVSAAMDFSTKAGKGEVVLFTSREPTRITEGPTSIPDLPIKETPSWHTTDLSKWANPAKFAVGSRTAGIQEAIDSGAEVVYLPNGEYWISEPIILRGSVRKLFGCEARINRAEGVDPLIRFNGVTSKTVFLEHLSLSGDVEHDCDQTLVIRKCTGGYRNTPRGTGDVFLEDVMSDNPQILYPQNLWARQLNSEYGERPNFTNRGGKAWILGMKVEGWVGGILNIGGVTECYALYAMTGENGRQPFVENREGWMAVSFRDGGQKNHFTKLKDTWDGVTKQQDTWSRECTLAVLGQRSDVKAAPKPAVPGDVQAQALNHQTVALSWTAPQSGAHGVSHYQITRNGKSCLGGIADQTTARDSGLSEGTAYTYEIATVDLRGAVSAAAKVTVTTPVDTVAPELKTVAIWPSDLSCITLDVSEALTPKAAQDPGSYRLKPAVAIRTATLSGDGTRVVLTTALPLSDGQTYALTCTGLKDRSAAGNPLAKPTSEFTAWQKGDGMRLEFWNDKESFAGKPVATTSESRIDHWWGDGAPLAGVTPMAFCARWSGILRPRASGEYTFITGIRSGGRVFLDGKLIHDQWGGGNEWTSSKPVVLEAGIHYALIFETHATGGQAGARLKWHGPGIKDEFLDDRVLFMPAKP